MTHKAFRPAPYKLIPFDPVPYFLVIAGVAIIVNLLVLLAVLLKSLRPNMVEHAKKLIRPEKKQRAECPCYPSRGSVDGDYEMDVGGSS